MQSCPKFIKTILKALLVKLFLCSEQAHVSLGKAKRTLALTTTIYHPSNKLEQGKETAKKEGLNCGKKASSQPWQRSASTDEFTPSLNPFSSHLYTAKML